MTTPTTPRDRLSLRNKRWKLAPRVTNERDIMPQILRQRGIFDVTDLEFRGARESKDITDLAILKFMTAIKIALDNQDQIVVYGDYDADGVTSTAMMVSYLRYLGAKVSPFIPSRFDDGYGLSIPALAGLCAAGAKLIITVDCGIRSIAEAEYIAQQTDVRLIITDHHEPGDTLPNAYAVINPKIGTFSPEPMIAGCGVVRRLIEVYDARWGKTFHPVLDEVALSHYGRFDLCAIGTVADLVPLNRPLNRAFVSDGLAAMREWTSPGIIALCNIAGTPIDDLTSDQIAFQIAPRINAAGRLGSAMLAYNLLMTTDQAEAETLALELDQLNRSRQSQTRKILDELTVDSSNAFVAAYSRDYPEGLIGLVAGKLTEEHDKPSMVFRIGADGICKGSARSPEWFDMNAALDANADLMIKHGGHKQAAGCTVTLENMPELISRLTKAANEIYLQDPVRCFSQLEIDAEIPLDCATRTLVREIDQLQPFGQEWRSPIFLARNVEVITARNVGTGGQHIIGEIRDITHHSTHKFVAWGMADIWPDDLMIDIVFAAEMNEYRGVRSVQLRIIDVRTAGVA